MYVRHHFKTCPTLQTVMSYNQFYKELFVRSFIFMRLFHYVIFQFLKNCIYLVIFESQKTLSAPIIVIGRLYFQHCFTPEKSVLPGQVFLFCFCGGKKGSSKTFILEGCYLCPSLQGSLNLVLFLVNNWELSFSTIIFLRF